MHEVLMCPQCIVMCLSLDRATIAAACPLGRILICLIYHLCVRNSIVSIKQYHFIELPLEKYFFWSYARHIIVSIMHLSLFSLIIDYNHHRNLHIFFYTMVCRHIFSVIKLWSFLSSLFLFISGTCAVQTCRKFNTIEAKRWQQKGRIMDS